MRTDVHLKILVILCVGLLMLAACDDNTADPPNITTLSGTYQMSAVAGAKIEVHNIDSDGTLTFVAGPATTNADGDWSIALPENASGPYVVRAAGGSYTDEVSGNDVTISSTSMMAGFISSGTVGQITPVSHAVYLSALARIHDGEGVAEALSNAAEAARNAFGFDVATTQPSASATASDAERQYAALLGGISKLVDDHKGILPPANNFEIVLGLTKDLADGLLDGLDCEGNELFVATEQMPDLDAAGIGALLTAANEYGAQLPSPPPAFDVNADFFPLGFRFAVKVFNLVGAPVTGLRVAAGSLVPCEFIADGCPPGALTRGPSTPLPAGGLQFAVMQESRVVVTIYDRDGGHVRTLVNSVRVPGLHSVVWDGKDDDGNTMRSAAYRICLVARDPETDEVLYQPDCITVSLLSIIDPLIEADAIDYTGPLGWVRTRSKLPFPYLYGDEIDAYGANGTMIGTYQYTDEVQINVVNEALGQGQAFKRTITPGVNRFRLVFNPATTVVASEPEPSVVENIFMSHTAGSEAAWSFGPFYPNPFN